MTMEEEIKARHKNGYWIMERQFKVPDGFDGGVCRVIDKDQKDKDFEWLLARNEELLRRLKSAFLEGWSDGFDEGAFRCTDSSGFNEAEHYWGQSETMEYLEGLDAKEQDDD